jgi:hypothetical protein
MRHRTCIVFAAVFALAACGERPATAPAEELGQLADIGKSKTTPGDSTASPPPPLPATFNLSGRVYGVTRIAPAPGVRDTLRHDPLAGVPLRVMRNLLVDGKATQVLAAETTSGSAGEFRLNGLAGGYYVIYATAPPGSPWLSTYTLVAGTSNEVVANVYLWHNQQ